jgi:hypothetical protein
MVGIELQGRLWIALPGQRIRFPGRRLGMKRVRAERVGGLWSTAFSARANPTHVPDLKMCQPGHNFSIVDGPQSGNVLFFQAVSVPVSRETIFQAILKGQNSAF